MYEKVLVRQSWWVQRRSVTFRSAWTITLGTVRYLTQLKVASKELLVGPQEKGKLQNTWAVHKGHVGWTLTFQHSFEQDLGSFIR